MSTAQATNLLIGTTPAIQEVRGLIEQVAITDAPVMLFGESGTGKELVARGIHEQSHRAREDFIPINMAALPPSLVESTLFGHERGAFTGAHAGRPGLCEAANRGTLFLDEVGEMDYDAQSKLLRFLEDYTYRRVGSVKTRRVNIRVVSATNRDTQQLIRTGGFREDLYYRLNVVPIHLPPLRDRRSDVPQLVDWFLGNATARYGKGPFQVTSRAMDALVAYDWPGNVRQLRNVVERIVVLARRGVIDLPQIPSEIRGHHPADDPPEPVSAAAAHLGECRVPAMDHGVPTMDQIEKQALLDALAVNDWNVVRAAKQLGIGQATAYRRMKRHGIPLRRPRRQADTQLTRAIG